MNKAEIVQAVHRLELEVLGTSHTVMLRKIKVFFERLEQYYQTKPIYIHRCQWVRRIIKGNKEGLMDACFSEFTYGFLLCHELINKLKSRQSITNLPTFPSLLQEAKLGYDVEIPRRGLPLFLQFKRAQYLRPTSRAKCSSGYTQPFFRIAIYKQQKSQQHDLLCALAQMQRNVYYAAPAFYSEEDFKSFFLRGEIRNRSVYIPLRKLNPLPDNDEHYITYTSTRALGFKWHSDQGIYVDHSIDGNDWLINIGEQLTHPQDLGLGYLLQLRGNLVEIIGRERLRYEITNDFVPILHDNDLHSLVRDVHYLLTTYFGATLIFLPFSEQ